MISHFQKIKREKFSPGPFLEIISVIFVLIVVGFLLFSNIKINQNKIGIKNQLSLIQKEINGFQEKNNEIKLQISKGLDQEYIEKVARQDLGLQKQGESVVGFILPPSPQNNPEAEKFWQPGSLLQSLGNVWSWLKSKL